MSSMIKWTVGQLLERHGVTAYRLMKESGLAQATTYRIANGDARGLNMETLDRLVVALRSLTGEEVQVADLLRYEEPAP